MRTVQSPRRNRYAALAVLVWTAAALPSGAQQITLDKEAYLTPPKEIVDAVLAPRHENVSLTNLSPDGKKFLITRTDGLPPLQRVGRPCVYLGESAFDHQSHRARQLWIRNDVGYDLFYYADRRTVPVRIPDGARVSNPAWSPDGSRLAYFAHFEDETHICVADTETGQSRKITQTPVLATLVTSFQWSRDGQRIQTVLLPEDGKRQPPKRQEVVAEPKVRVARDGANPSRTYRYLLDSPYDVKLLEYLVTGQLALIDVNDGRVSRIGAPAMLRSVNSAPGEQHHRVTTLKKPFSYYVPMARFGTLEEVWSPEGKSLHVLADRNLRENEPTPPPTTVATAGAGRGGRGGAGRGGAPATAPAPAPAPRIDPTDPDPDKPLRPTEPVDPNAKRDIVWRPDGNGLSYLQLEPANPKDASQPRKDRVYQWLPPFAKDEAKVIYETPHRISNLQYSEDCRTLFLTQTVDNQRQIAAVEMANPKTVYVISRTSGRPTGDQPPTKPMTGDGSEDDEQQRVPGAGIGGAGFGAAAASGLMTRTGRGSSGVVRISQGGEVYLTGSERGRGGEGTQARPYIDKVHIKTGKKTRIFESKGDMVETIDAVESDEIKHVFTTRQKADVVPDSYLNDLASGKATKLTNNVNHTPWFNQLPTQRLQVTRVDGFKFWVRVTTPLKPTGKLPALFWIYPREYTDQAAYNASAGRGGVTSGRFNAPGPRSMTLLTQLGYAVVEPDVPIVGPAGRMNDNYIPDLRNSLWAVIDELDRKGLIDRDRLAVGGHSYGAFSTANALAHTPFFKAGIAGDGNYNRTLTPMTFQAERRQIWDARETYLEMSPLLWANRVNGALLMYHGMDDANTGTNPINAEYLFMALDGLGKPASLYMYPYEGHGPSSKETTLDLWARWAGWLDKYVKNPPKK